MKKIISIVLGLLMFAPVFVYAQPTGTSITGEAETQLKGAVPVDLQSATDPFKLISGIINTVIGVLGVIAVALIVYAGGLWLTAAGNDEKVGEAKKIISSTVIGIIIVGLAYAITAFILAALVG